MTTPLEPGERVPGDRSGGEPSPPASARTILDRPPGDRYGPTTDPADRSGGALERAGPPLAVAAVGVALFVLLGGVLAVTAGLLVIAGLVGWLTGLFVRPPARAATVAVGVVLLGLAGIWLFGRWEGGVLDPIEYFAEVQGILVPFELVVAAGLAAAASR
ncbi:MAG TPA: hypothetical protein VNM34_11935 [Verrucomicrobiae bacterium]|nr:hypothetical protein [Verrucomicrobiae bacterium]